MRRLQRLSVAVLTSFISAAPVAAWACTGIESFELLWPVVGEPLPAGSGLVVLGSTWSQPSFELHDSAGDEVPFSLTKLSLNSQMSGLFFVLPEGEIEPGEQLDLTVNSRATPSDPIVEFPFDVLAGDSTLPQPAEGEGAVVWETYFAEGELGANSSCTRSELVSISAYAVGGELAVPRLLVARSSEGEVGRFVPAGRSVDEYLALLPVTDISSEVTLEVLALDGQLLSNETLNSPTMCFDPESEFSWDVVPDGDSWYYHADLVQSVARPCGAGPDDAGCGVTSIRGHLGSVPMLALILSSVHFISRRRKMTHILRRRS